jgi:hypothetical protein
MKDNQPSTTAMRVAMRRAAHQLLDNPRVFHDPLAIRIIGREDATVLRADPSRHEDTKVSPFLRAFVAARSRCVEDELAAGVRRGVCQYVILGAGLSEVPGTRSSGDVIPNYGHEPRERAISWDGKIGEVGYSWCAASHYAMRQSATADVSQRRPVVPGHTCRAATIGWSRSRRCWR